MGYCIEQMDSSFVIKQENFQKALDALKAFMAKAEYLSWVRPEEVSAAKTLKDALAACRWAIAYDADGNVDSIYFTGEKSGSDQEIFSSLVPFVEEGSYIEMRGEDGAIWRWVFKDGTCREVAARIVFDY